VLFADVVGSTALSMTLDVEDYHALLRSYQQAVGAVVERFGGVVAQVHGDGVVAHFGHPVAQEDDAERAVRAGLEIVHAVHGLDRPVAVDGAVQVRVGVHTGPVVVGAVQSGSRREVLALGETNNIAARLQAEAAPGSVVMSAATLRLVAGVFVVKDLGVRVLKGLVGGMQVLEAVRVSGVRSRFELAAARGLTPMVGRTLELGLLADRWERVRDGVGQTVLIGGEAGIGKSRIVHAFRESLRATPHTWLECRCSPYATATPFHPVLELHRQAMDLVPSAEPADEQLNAIAACMAASEFELDESVPLVAAMHDLDVGGRFAPPGVTPGEARRRTIELLAEWLLRLGAVQPVVLLIEDVQWIDPSTWDLLDLVVEHAPRSQVLVLVTHRPAFDTDWTTRAAATSMTVDRLTRRQVAQLVRSASTTTLDDATVEQIVERADGVALFAEELAAAAAGSFGEAGAIPETLQDSLMGRLDALSDAKRVAQLAAVIGREAGHELLQCVWPCNPLALQRALDVALEHDVLERSGSAPYVTYQFRHALLRDVAYQSMLRRDRRATHRAVADALVERQPLVASIQPELVAHHLHAAGDAVDAVEWWGRAIQRAEDRGARDEAVRHARQALDLARSLPLEDRDRITHDLRMQLARLVPMRSLVPVA
jgi:class 3 adenylate cyclase